MAAILVVICGILGFGSAVVSVLLFDIGLFQAFIVWMVGGFSVMVLALLPALLPPRKQDKDHQPKIA